jgi:hypothetical protein
MKKEEGEAHFNIEAEDEIIGLNNKVGQIRHIDDIGYATTVHAAHLM